MRSVTKSNRWLVVIFISVLGLVAFGETTLKGLFEAKGHPPDKLGTLVPYNASLADTQIERARLILYAGQTNNFVSAVREMQTSSENKPSLEALSTSAIYRELGRVMMDGKITVDQELVTSMQSMAKEFVSRHWLQKRVDEVGDYSGLNVEQKRRLRHYVGETPDYSAALTSAVRKIQVN